MNDRRYVLTLVATCTTILVATSMLARGGPLSPPPGPVAPTMLTLDMIEPRTPIGPDTTPGDSANLFIINQPGSYFLTGNIIGQAGKTGIRITADHVRLDLNGFTLQGVSESREGIRIYSSWVTVRNGSVTGWGRQGLRGFSELSQEGTVVEHVSAIDNVDDGIDVYENAIIRNCQAHQNGGHGIEVYSGSLIEDCIVRYNTMDGIHTNFGCMVQDCSALQNGGHGIRVGTQSQVIQCLARANLQHGFEALDSCNFISCSSDANTMNGFHAGNRAIFQACGASDNGVDGMYSGFASIVSGCSAMNNGEDGIWVSFGSAVSVSASRINGGYGIYCNTGGNVSFASCYGNDRGVSAGQIFGVNATGNSITGINANGFASHSYAYANGYGFIATAYGRVHECSARANGQGFKADPFDDSIVSGCSAFDSTAENFDNTFSGQDTNTPVGATAWQNFAESLP
ncbi:MAG: right-handed parallel beta-helix repeat-containing protein [Phycisphaerales bacterium]|nr:right-handed parallel beta-helix repeat-containing protein [Phycisphaerales bacterium]